ncbi:unnamed protein product [Colias eurytheme]|nr:unnamed protein product [Colias eurytheme]
MAIHWMNCSKWPDPLKDEVAYVDNPIESGFPGHWLPLSVIKKMMEMRVITLATDTLQVQPAQSLQYKDYVTMKLKLKVTAKAKLGRRTTEMNRNEPLITKPVINLSSTEKGRKHDETTAVDLLFPKESTTSKAIDEITVLQPETKFLFVDSATPEISIVSSKLSLPTTPSTVSTTFLTVPQTTTTTLSTTPTIILTKALTTTTSPSTITTAATTSKSTTTTQSTTTKPTTTITTTQPTTTKPTTLKTTSTTTTKPTTTTTTETGNPFY